MRLAKHGTSKVGRLCSQIMSNTSLKHQTSRILKSVSKCFLLSFAQLVAAAWHFYVRRFEPIGGGRLESASQMKLQDGQKVMRHFKRRGNAKETPAVSRPVLRPNAGCVKDWRLRKPRTSNGNVSISVEMSGDNVISYKL